MEFRDCTVFSIATVLATMMAGCGPEYHELDGSVKDRPKSIAVGLCERDHGGAPMQITRLYDSNGDGVGDHPYIICKDGTAVLFRD